MNAALTAAALPLRDADTRDCLYQLCKPGGLTAARIWVQHQGWNAWYADKVLEAARKRLIAESAQTIEEVRVRMVAMLELECADCEQTITQEDGSKKRSKDRSALAKFAQLLVTLHGLNQSTVNHVAGRDRPLQDLTTEQLLAEEAKCQAEIYARMPNAEVLSTSTIEPELCPIVVEPESEPVAAEPAVPDYTAAGAEFRRRASQYSERP